MKIKLMALCFLIAFSCVTKGNLSDKEIVEHQVKGFLAWYSNHWEEVSVDLINPIIENSMLDQPDSTRPYKINFKAAEIYLDVFRKSGFISEAYIETYRQYFKECQLEFEKEPHYEGPPTGFEYDFIFRSQDYQYQRDNPDKAKTTEISITANKATVTIQYDEVYSYIYKLSKVNNDWLIDSIKGSWESRNYND
ncbi:MAG: hypothetical protein C0523_06310 [Cytophaga sp.]|nr:hypothetical protein [Cytophaga sp.]